MPNAAPDLWTLLNRECRCIGVEVEQVQRWIERDLIEHGIGEPLVSTHPHLFANLPVFVDESHLTQAYEVIGAVETLVARADYRHAVLASAPEIAAIDNHARGVLLGYDFHVSAEGVRLIEINTNAGGALLNALLLRAQQACCAEPRGPEHAAELYSVIIAMFEREWALARGDARPLRRSPSSMTTRHHSISTPSSCSSRSCSRARAGKP